MASHRKKKKKKPECLPCTGALGRAPVVSKLQPAPAGQPSLASSEETILRAAQATAPKHPRLRAIVHEGLTALCRAWTTYTLKRATADVAAMSERDYREFGLDKAEILTALRRLRDEIEGGGRFAARNVGREDAGYPLSIMVSNRTCGSLWMPVSGQLGMGLGAAVWPPRAGQDRRARPMANLEALSAKSEGRRLPIPQKAGGRHARGHQNVLGC